MTLLHKRTLLVYNNRRCILHLCMGFIMKKQKVGCVLLAAGLSSRFGRNKLLEKWEGRSLIDRALAAVPSDRLSQIVVVTRFPEVRVLAQVYNFEVVWNNCPEEGISASIRLGLNMLKGVDAAMFMVCDQVFLTQAGVSALVDFYHEHPDRIVCMSYNGERGNPCIFPAAFFPELLALRGDIGGGAVIKRYEPMLLRFDVSNAAELMDVDHPEDMPENAVFPLVSGS